MVNVKWTYIVTWLVFLSQVYGESLGISSKTTIQAPRFSCLTKKNGQVVCEIQPPRSNHIHQSETFVNPQLKDVKLIDEDRGAANDNDMELTLEEPDWHYWKALAFALIGLSALIIVATIVVVVACLRLQRALIVKQREENEIDDADSGYVVIHTLRGIPHSTYSTDNAYTTEEIAAHSPFLTSRDTALGESVDGIDCVSAPQSPQSMRYLPRVYKPQRRLLNYDADDVFESDDQSHHTSRHQFRNPPIFVPQNLATNPPIVDESMQDTISSETENANLSSLHNQKQKLRWFWKKRKKDASVC